MVLPFFSQQKRITVRTKKQEVEVADVLRQFEGAYRQQHGLSQKQEQVLRSLKLCRTAELGGHIYECHGCGALEFTYGSCGDDIVRNVANSNERSGWSGKKWCCCRSRIFISPLPPTTL